MKKMLALVLSTTFITTAFSGCAKKECTKHHYSYFDSEIVKEATCTTTGIKKVYCTNCNHSKEETIPIEHDFQQKSVLKKASCTVNGLALYECNRCGETEEQTIYAAHDFYNRKCLLCGYHQPLPELSVGMSKYTVKSKWGEPLDIDTHTSQLGTSEIWWYKDNGNTISLYFGYDGKLSSISQ